MAGQYDTAWSDFWAQDQNAEEAGGCLPEKWREIGGAQRKIWQEFSKKLPRSSNVLDIATGDGRVMRWLLKERRDLKLVGADLAAKLPPPPKGTKVKSGVAMEHLPFPDSKFDAVISQFGFEYGDLPKAAAELARVLKAGGRAGLITHRADGPILAHNLARRDQIGWAIEDNGLVELAKNSLRLRSAGVAAIPAKIGAAPAEGARLFGEDSAAWEIAEAVRQTLVLGMRDHPANVARLLDTIASRARNEMGRISSLENACRQTSDAEAFHGALAASGLKQIEITPICELSGDWAFADFRQIRHADT